MFLFDLFHFNIYNHLSEKLQLNQLECIVYCCCAPLMRWKSQMDESCALVFFCRWRSSRWRGQLSRWKWRWKWFRVWSISSWVLEELELELVRSWNFGRLVGDCILCRMKHIVSTKHCYMDFSRQFQLEAPGTNHLIQFDYKDPLHHKQWYNPQRRLIQYTTNFCGRNATDRFCKLVNNKDHTQQKQNHQWASWLCQ